MTKKRKRTPPKDGPESDLPLDDLPPALEATEPDLIPVTYTVAEPTKAPKEAPKPLRPEGVPFRVFALVGGFKPDQVAGFGSYAKRKDLGPMGIKAWRDEYQAFLRLPA